MGKVILNLDEYNQLKKQAESRKELAECFSVKKSYSGEVRLCINIPKAQEIFKVLFKDSSFDNGKYEINEKECEHSDDILSYYINATEIPEEPKEDIENETI